MLLDVCIGTQGRDVNDVTNGHTLLQNGCNTGDVEIIEFLKLKCTNVDANVIDKETNETILQLASKHDNVQILKMVLNSFNFDFDKLVNHCSNEKCNGESVFLRLCYLGHLQCLNYLLTYSHNHDGSKVNILATDMYGRNALHLAIQRAMRDEEKGIQMIKYLLENVYFGKFRNTLNGKDCVGSTPLHFACASDEQGAYVSDKIVRLLIKHGCDINTFNNLQRIPKHYLQCKNYFETYMNPLIQHHEVKNVNIRHGDTGCQITPLMVAILQMDTTCINILCDQPDIAITISNNAPIASILDNSEDKMVSLHNVNYCTMELACFQGRVDVIEKLVSTMTGNSKSHSLSHDKLFQQLIKKFATFNRELVLSWMDCLNDNQSRRRWQKREVRIMLKTALTQLDQINQESKMNEKQHKQDLYSTINWQHNKEMAFHDCKKQHCVDLDQDTTHVSLQTQSKSQRSMNTINHNIVILDPKTIVTSNGDDNYLQHCAICNKKVDVVKNKWTYICTQCTLFVCDHCCVAIELENLINSQIHFKSFENVTGMIVYGIKLKDEVKQPEIGILSPNPMDKIYVTKRVK